MSPFCRPPPTSTHPCFPSTLVPSLSPLSFSPHPVANRRRSNAQTAQRQSLPPTPTNHPIRLYVLPVAFTSPRSLSPASPHETLQRFSLEAPDTPRVPRHDVRGCLEEASSMILKGLADSATGYDKLGALFRSYVGVQVFVVRIQGLISSRS